MNCSICNVDEKNTAKFYYNSIYGSNLCNKHYIQIRRYGKIIDDTPNIKLDSCEICGYKNGLTRCGLEGEYKGKTLCLKHYSQIVRIGNIVDSTPSIRDRERVCEVCKEHNSNDIIFCPTTNQMLCRRHYDHVFKYGKILERTVFDKNTYELKLDNYGEYAEIILRNKFYEEVTRTMIDIEDLEKVLQIVWGYSTWGYATNAKGNNKKFIMLQNYIMDKEGMIDHIDRNPLNNRKYNLKLSNKSF